MYREFFIPSQLIFEYSFSRFYKEISLLYPFQRCAFCKHFGATIKCCEEKRTQMYHYPCAAGAGSFQDFSHIFLLCPEHIDQAPERSKEDANCAVCDSPGDLLDQFFCITCGQHYHGMCLDIAVTPLKRAGWQCPECKVCHNCKQSGEDSKMLVCDTCDKGYHTFCLQRIMKSVPTNGWKCKLQHCFVACVVVFHSIVVVYPVYGGCNVYHTPWIISEDHPILRSAALHSGGCFLSVG
nr:histone-lysine N-methyltransferase 2C-like isoform X4 [Gorilla gorilla gorilla]